MGYLKKAHRRGMKKITADLRHPAKWSTKPQPPTKHIMYVYSRLSGAEN
jgi:hypothetical protein